MTTSRAKTGTKHTATYFLGCQLDTGFYMDHIGEFLKGQLIGKDPDARKDLRQEEKGTTEDEMVGWHQRLSGY